MTSIILVNTLRNIENDLLHHLHLDHHLNHHDPDPNIEKHPTKIEEVKSLPLALLAHQGTISNI